MRAMVLYMAGAPFELEERPVTRTFALAEAEQAHTLLGQGAIIGRAALVTG